MLGWIWRTLINVFKNCDHTWDWVVDVKTEECIIRCKKCGKEKKYDFY